MMTISASGLPSGSSPFEPPPPTSGGCESSAANVTPGDACDALEDLRETRSCALLGRAVLRGRQRDARAEHAVRVEADRLLLQVDRAAHQQRRAGEHDHHQRRLRADQRLPHPRLERSAERALAVAEILA